ncbi:hypothetical protein C7974DRAFT_185455 [Boeremia exigua]|uniref:uncharacterized protein n=1 Tax=Boeremia exigua TaxID=749465 RepID=UPI001E8E8E2D|nr:uncharacterized protein C7974DRAFT_185455 [Boeremia exigua]KAH6629381.1 hypothetical protein C7974DRAFT_185455 [Boeremia exigua]
MLPTSQKEGPGIKVETEQQSYVQSAFLHRPLLTPQRLSSIPDLSTIAEFLKDGQDAFGRVDPQLLEKCGQTSGKMKDWMLEQLRERLAARSELYYDELLILRPLLNVEYGPNTKGLHCLYPELSRLMRSNLTYAVVCTDFFLEAPGDEIPQAMKDTWLRDVAQDMSTVLIDMGENDTLDCRRANFEQKDAGHQPLAKLSPAALGLFTKRFYGLGLHQQTESMLLQLRLQMDHALAMDLHRIYVPYLQDLISLMLMYGIPMTNTTYGLFFERVLHNYFKRFLGQDIRDQGSIEHRSWTLRANEVRIRMESFDHTYFREILGHRYDIVILPVVMKLPPGPQAHGQLDSL